MKRIFLFGLGYLLMFNGVGAQDDKGIHFEQGNWTQIKEMAKKEKKFIFVDCFASWCGPCKAMDRDTYTSGVVGSYMNDHFVSIKMQMDTSRQDNDQIRLYYADAHFIMQEYKINAFPTFLFFSPDGNIVHREVGFMNEDKFIAVAKDAMNSDKQYYSLLERYRLGKLDTTYMKPLARQCISFGEKELGRKIANDFIDRQKEETLYTSDNIWLMVVFTTTSKDRGFSIFRDHADKIHQAVHRISVEDAKGLAENIIYKEEIQPYITSRNGEPDWSIMELNVKKYDSLGEETYRKFKPGIIFNSEIKPLLIKDPTWTKILSAIKGQHAGKVEEFLVGSSVVFYLNSGLVSGESNDCSNFTAAASYYFKNYYSYLTADPLNSWAWTVFERSSDKKELAEALVWSDSCLKLNNTTNAGHIDTYANLLYKLGKLDEAMTWEEKAARLAPGNSEIQVNYSKMKRGENTWKDSE